MSEQQNSFIYTLNVELENSLSNDFNDNYDEDRFGELKYSFVEKLRRRVKLAFFRDQINRVEVSSLLKKSNNILFTYSKELEEVYNLLSDAESKKLMIKLLCLEILGYRRVKLPSNNSEYLEKKIMAEDVFNYNESIDANFLGKTIQIFLADLNKINIPIKLYTKNVFHEFINEQYKYKDDIKVEQGDIVFDCGSCYGDTALHFAHLVGETGKVIGFEFIPSNMHIMQENLNLNPNLKSKIELVNKAVWNSSNLDIYLKDRGPGSKVSLENFDDCEGVSKTITVDETVENLQLERVDFIKMDIEGAELKALDGALQTIGKFKPKLAIASYHSMDDFARIPLWINSLNLGYKIYLGHPTIHWEETIVFASIN